MPDYDDSLPPWAQDFEKRVAQRTRDLDEKRRNAITMQRAPVLTLYNFLFVLIDWTVATIKFMGTHRFWVGLLAALTFVGARFMANPGAELEDFRDDVWESGLFVFWWVTLGIMSSVGLGTGLHTFLLFTGPHIIRVTVAAQRCHGVDFDVWYEHYFPVMKYSADSFVCDSVGEEGAGPLFLEVLGKVQLPAILWGLGTAIGELPPYFVARAARLAGERLAELDDVSEEDDSTMGRLKAHVYHYVQRGGFWAILLFAAIPNPLFDLAGITCGHFLIPFWTFFLATAIGKALVKVHLQATFFILLFNKHTLHLFPFLEALVQDRGQFVQQSCRSADMSATVADCVRCCGTMLHDAQQLVQCHAACELPPEEKSQVVSMLWNVFIGGMVVFFLVSIINSSVHDRLARKALEREQGKAHLQTGGARAMGKAVTMQAPIFMAPAMAAAGGVTGGSAGVSGLSGSAVVARRSVLG